MEQEQPRKKKILIVEDDQEIGHLYLDLLMAETNSVVILANEPFQALNIVDQFKPDLFILDYMLPHMDGLELYNRLHTIKGLEKIPALFITGTILDKKGKEPGIVRMQKPFDIDILLQTIDNITTPLPSTA
ncbi:MAG TPA: response regulator [Candidatus Nitrosopolaris rasttigaisensis]|nr:response regulator [Candidatus Nitrosopolaris rasttigaisensis]